MSIRLKTAVVAATALVSSSSALAVDLVGIYELAATNDPQLQAASFRRDATGENVIQARSALLPSLSGSAGMGRGDTETDIAGIGRVSQNDIDTQTWSLDLNQTIYDHANYKRLDLARGQVSRAEAVYQQAYQDFLVRVAGRYFDVLTAIDGVTFAEAEELALQRQFEQAEQRFEVGLTAVTDVHEARASYDNARARAIVARVISMSLTPYRKSCPWSNPTRPARMSGSPSPCPTTPRCLRPSGRWTSLTPMRVCSAPDTIRRSR
jgi:outer membrane protein